MTMSRSLLVALLGVAVAVAKPPHIIVLLSE